MEKRYKRLLAVSVFIVLFLPLMQDVLGIFPEGKLIGRIDKNSIRPQLTRPNWFKGKWQDSTQLYCNDHFGLHPWFMRLNNQLYFSVFDRARANLVVIGKNNFLHDAAFIKAYTGEDCAGYKYHLNWMQKFQYVQNALAKKGITLLFVMLPGKTSYYPETLPEKYANIPRRTTNNMLLAQIGDSLGTNCVNLVPWLLSLKHISPYPLFPPYGIHWSEYGMLLGMDSVGKYIEQKRRIDLPDVSINHMYWTDSLKNPDMDIAAGMNLLFDLPKVKMAYPDYTMNTDGKTQLNALAVGDSYYWNFFGSSAIERAFFKNSHFWFYFRELHIRDQMNPEADHAKIDLRKEILSQQVIMVFQNESNLKKPGNGFIEEVYDMMTYSGTYAGKKEKRLLDIEKDIYKDKNWMELIKQKAAAKNIPLAQMVSMDAKYVLDHEWE